MVIWSLERFLLTGCFLSKVVPFDGHHDGKLGTKSPPLPHHSRVFTDFWHVTSWRSGTCRKGVSLICFDLFWNTSEQIRRDRNKSVYSRQQRLQIGRNRSKFGWPPSANPRLGGSEKGGVVKFRACCCLQLSSLLVIWQICVYVQDATWVWIPKPQLWYPPPRLSFSSLREEETT